MSQLLQKNWQKSDTLFLNIKSYLSHYGIKLLSSN